ncbi:hypothetical protein ACFT9I_28920 [Streptomyces sp. NPDC057137]|uniref:hypothetical protein n=1 Tax=Streptomyces sp. NPDC057137 TaxID=3346030 RepID=UPI00363D77A7
MNAQRNETTFPTTAGRDTALRLLPWNTLDGKPCYLSADGSGGVVSRLADEVEEAQTESGSEVLGGAKAVLADANAGTRELRFALARATESLGDVLRVAESRGARLPTPYEDDEEGDEDDGPRLPAESFG